MSSNAMRGPDAPGSEWARLRESFPFFKERPGIIYFDSAATSQKPHTVLERARSVMTRECANPRRGIYPLATQLERCVEECRERVRRFLHARSEDVIVFTSGATESLRTCAELLRATHLTRGGRVVLCPHDHRASVGPWYSPRFAEGTIVTLEPRRHGALDATEVGDALQGSAPSVAALTHIHHVYGNNFALTSLLDRPKESLVSLDAAQSVGHIPVDVSELPVDFVSFSAHKMFGLPGCGVLWIRECAARRCDALSEDSVIQRCEQGSLNVPGIVALDEAIAFIEGIGIQRISARLAELTQYALARLRLVEHVDFLPGPAHWACPDGHGILSFQVRGARSSDIGFILGNEGICVRTGDHCVHGRPSFGESIRMSFQIYNTEEEIDRCVDLLAHICRTI